VLGAMADWAVAGDELAENAEGADDDGTFVVLPCIGAPGECVSVFSDGSWARWAPKSAAALSEAWNVGGSLVGALSLMLCDAIGGGVLG
jgi:hypothetical protein